MKPMMISYIIWNHIKNEVILFVLTIRTHLDKEIGKKLNEFIYYLKPYNKWIQIHCETNEVTFQKEFACNPSLTAEVLINFIRESRMFLSLSLTLSCSKNRFTTRQRADLTSLGKTWSQKEPGFLPYLFVYSMFPMWRVFPALCPPKNPLGTWERKDVFF